MKNKRRDFIKHTGLTGIAIASNGMINSIAASTDSAKGSTSPVDGGDKGVAGFQLNVIGAYGEWAAGLNGNSLPALSFRKKEFSDLASWKKTAREKLFERLAVPKIIETPKVTIHKQYEYDGLQVEELSWSLPYGNPTEAILLKPLNLKGKLPAILAFHDHGGVKYFGTRKITKTSDDIHPMMKKHQQEYYSGFAWANEVAKRGYLVLVSDAFPFASRRVLIKDVPVEFRKGLTDEDPEKTENIHAYDEWATAHEHIMAKSLFSAGTTWAGVFFAEDRIALDILSARPDVDPARIGCGGLSGGGMRTVFLSGLDDRIKCAVSVGFMTTWSDFVLNKSPNHTWMTYVPLLPNDLDFPEILGIRAPLPTLVLNNLDDNLFTLAEMKTAEKILSAVFDKAKAPDKYKCSFHPGPHKFDKLMQEEAFDWFDKWLKV